MAKKGYTPWNKGIPRSESTRKKISIASKGKIAWNKGKKMGSPSIAIRKKYRKAQMKVIAEGRHNLWKGGISVKNRKIRMGIEFRLWREAIFARDNWTCQKCNKRDGSEIHPHHTLSFAKHSELRFVVDNGITFCKKCHREFHRKYGNDNNQYQLKEFLNEK